MTARSEWIEVPAQSKQIGPFRVVYLKSKKGAEGAHLVQFPDGRDVRVLPDGHNSGQKRSRTIQEALTTLEIAYRHISNWKTVRETSDGKLKTVDAPLDPVAYLTGVLHAAGMTWETVEDRREMSFEDWLLDWWGPWSSPDGRGPMRLLDDMADAGWKTLREGEK